MAVRVSVIAVQRNGCPGTFSQSMCVRYGSKTVLCVCASLRFFGEEQREKVEVESGA
jgi:hypothetical protein